MVNILYSVPYERYNEQVMGILKKDTKKYKNILYITMNKTASSLLVMLKEHNIKIEKFSFLDAATPKLFQTKPQAHCFFIESFSDMNKAAESILTAFSMVRPDLVVWDSVSSAIAYKSENDVINLLEYLIPLFGKKAASVFFLILEKDIERPAVKQLEMIVDKTIPA